MTDIFKFDISDFSAGWECIILHFNQIQISFDASDIGNEPIAQLINATLTLDEFNGSKKPNFAYFNLDSEPGKLKAYLKRNIRTNLLNIKIEIYEDDSYDKKRMWEIRDFSYDVFRQGVVQSAAKVLLEYGLLGFSMNWNWQDVTFPILDYLKLLGNDAIHSENDNSYHSNGMAEFESVLKVIKSLVTNISK